MMSFTPNKEVSIEFLYYLTMTINFGKYAQVGALPSYNALDIFSIKTKFPLLMNKRKYLIFFH